MTTQPPLKNTGPFWRRLGQALGLVFNDDGTVSPAHLESPKGREAMQRRQKERERKEAEREEQ